MMNNNINMIIKIKHKVYNIKKDNIKYLMEIKQNISSKTNKDK